MDEEIEKRNEDNILHTGLRAWLKEINLLEYSSLKACLFGQQNSLNEECRL